MKKTDKDTKPEINFTEGEELPGYSHYSESEDIFTHDKKVADITPDGEIEDIEKAIGKENSDPSLDAGLDVPGAEDDDEMEANGDEDEENNYYSLGGDNHNDLEEDNSAN